MKTNISNRLLTMLSIVICQLTFTAVLSSCSSDDPFYTANENDVPRILNTDIPEGSNGEPALLTTITRSTNFTFEVIVTPMDYTTVTWFVDDEPIAEGLTIDEPLLAGDHILKIVATTTKGLSTSRTCRVVVRPAEGDPELASDAASRWLTVGTTKTIQTTNATDVTRVFVGKQEATNVSFVDGQLTFDVPQMDEGEYTVAIEEADGMRYGCGLFTVSNEEYVAPAVEEVTLWIGEFEVTWGTSFDILKTTFASKVQAGTILRVYTTGSGGQGSATTAWWNNIVTGQGDPNRGDLPINGNTVLGYTLTDYSLQLLSEQDGFLIVGNGYKVLKVTIE